MRKYLMRRKRKLKKKTKKNPHNVSKTVQRPMRQVVRTTFLCMHNADKMPVAYKNV